MSWSIAYTQTTQSTGSVLDEPPAVLSEVAEKEPEAAATIRSMLYRLVTPPQPPTSPLAARADAERYLAARSAIGEQATLQALFNQYGSSLANIPPELAALLGMCGVDPSAVVRCVQEFAIRTIVNVLQDTQQRRDITATAAAAGAKVRTHVA